VPNVPRQQISTNRSRTCVPGGVPASLFSAQFAEFRSPSSRLQTPCVTAVLPGHLTPVQYAQGCFLAIFGYNRESDLAFLDIEDCVSRIPLREDCLLFGKGDDFATVADGGEEVYLGDRRSLIFCDPYAVAMRTGERLTSA